MSLRGPSAVMEKKLLVYLQFGWWEVVRVAFFVFIVYTLDLMDVG